MALGVDAQGIDWNPGLQSFLIFFFFNSCTSGMLPLSELLQVCIILVPSVVPSCVSGGWWELSLLHQKDAL